MTDKLAIHKSEQLLDKVANKSYLGICSSRVYSIDPWPRRPF